MSNSLESHRLYSPWNSPDQNPGVGSCSLLQGIFPTQGSNPGLPQCRQILYQLSQPVQFSRTFRLPLKAKTFKMIYICFINAWLKRWGSSFGKKVLLEVIFLYDLVPLLTEEKRISWSRPPLLFSCLTMHTCSLSIASLVKVSQLNFMYVSLVLMISPCWDSRIVLPFFSFHCTLIASGKNFWRRQRCVPAIWSFTSSTEGKNIVGLGNKSPSSLLSVGGMEQNWKELLEKHTCHAVWNNLA